MIFYMVTSYWHSFADPLHIKIRISNSFREQDLNFMIQVGLNQSHISVQVIALLYTGYLAQLRRTTLLLYNMHKYFLIQFRMTLLSTVSC